MDFTMGRTALASSLVAVLISGCGPQAGGGSGSADADGDGGSASASASSQGDASASASASGSGDDGGSASAGTGPASCDEFRSDPEIGPVVAIEIRNEASVPVFIQPIGCSAVAPVQIKPVDQADPIGWIGGDCFPELCDAFLESSDCAIGCPDCAAPALTRIDPGGMSEVNWPGVSFAGLQMTAECAPGPGCQTNCLRADQAPPGGYALSLPAFRECTGNCECSEPPMGGVCRVWDFDHTLGDPVEPGATIEYPAETTAALVFTD